MNLWILIIIPKFVKPWDFILVTSLLSRHVNGIMKIKTQEDPDINMFDYWRKFINKTKKCHGVGANIDQRKSCNYG